MATFTRVNGISGQRNSFASTLQLKAFKVTPGTAFADGVDGTGELFAREIGTTGAIINVKSDGTSAVVVGDGHALDAQTLAIRIDKILGGEGAVVNYLNDGYASGSGSAVAGTAAAPVTTALVSVGELSSFYSIS